MLMMERRHEALGAGRVEVVGAPVESMH